jgi:hypothetical protein
MLGSFTTIVKKQSHYTPEQALGLDEVEVPRFEDIGHLKVVRMSSIRTGRLYPSPPPQDMFLVLISVIC